MPELSNLILFITTSLALLVIPGPAVLYIVGKSMDQGLKAGLVSVLGIGIGSIAHVIAASIGISALLVASATAFTIVKLAGAFYLIYLGIKTLLRKETHSAIPRQEKKRMTQIFAQGIIVNLFNPKTALFFFAFLPQFISPGSASVSTQIIFLGIIFTLLAVATDSIYALMSSKLSQALRGSNIFIRLQKYVIGTIYLILGVATLTVSSHSADE